ncbi:MAG: metal-dependent transcriptional regulator [Actinomycetota bacterium]|nr:metal-dependent transcriptional regulator [Actinomycetota bacterium]
MSSPRIEEYLEAIFKIEEKTGHPVNISRLAENLGLSVPSASEMMKKLEQIGVIAYNEHREVSLTEAGVDQAIRVVRRHRLAERFLTDILGLSWDQVHEEACLLEHAISPLVEERLAERLGNPQTCPHGHPIPGGPGKVKAERLAPLSDLTAGAKARVALIRDEEPDVLIYLAGLELRPDADLTVEEIAPFGGPITIEINGARHAIGPELASRVMVEKK